MHMVGPSHRKTRNWSDRIALSAIRTLRWGMDLVTGYKHDKAVVLAKTDPGAAKQKFAMNERKWLIRYIFLESVAGKRPR
jgi:ubiquinol oxidase